MMQKCLACGGVYEPVGADNVPYYHACPPLSVFELDEAIRANAVVLGPLDQARLDVARKQDQQTPPAKGALTREQAVLQSLNIKRPNHRDENIVAPRRDDEQTTIVAAGAGVVDISEEELAVAVTKADV